VAAKSPALVAVRQAIMPPPLAVTPEPDSAEPLSLDLLMAEGGSGSDPDPGSRGGEHARGGTYAR
jgi:hypothetical protein